MLTITYITADTALCEHYLNRLYDNLLKNESILKTLIIAYMRHQKGIQIKESEIKFETDPSGIYAIIEKKEENQ